MIRRFVRLRFAVIAALSLLLFVAPLVSVSQEVGPQATGQLLRNDTGLYPRAVRLSNGVVVASVVGFGANGSGLGAIYQSTDDGSTFSQIGTVADPLAANGGGLCCATLFELPRPVGALSAGTLLWAASVGQDTPNRRMALRIWRSSDQGRTWSFLSSCRTAPNTGGLWEPEFSVDAAGRLVCHFADETRSAQHSQLLARTTSTDAVNWSAPADTVALDVQGQRPGMPTVRRMPDGSYYMVYEVCGVPGQFDCAARFRTSADGSNWGDVRDIGPLISAVDGSYFTHAPVVAWAANGTPRGRLLVTGQQLRLADGTPSADSGRTILVNTEGGFNRWFAIPAPVAVPEPPNNFCPNYSSALLPSVDGRRVLEIATDWDGSVCKPYYATGSAVGSGDAAGLVADVFYRFVNVHSGHCLDVAADSRVQGGNIQQWTCNNLGPQDFRLTFAGTNEAVLAGRNSGMCMDVLNGSTQAGGDVVQWGCANVGSQRWRANNVGRGYYVFTAVHSGMCLDVTGGSFDPGANVQQWQCNQLAPQIWKAERR